MEPFRRDMRPAQDVIGHGIDLDARQPAEHRGYVPGTRIGRRRATRPAYALASGGAGGLDVCAQALPLPNLTIVGAQPHATMMRTHPARGDIWRPPARRLGSHARGAGRRRACAGLRLRRHGRTGGAP